MHRRPVEVFPAVARDGWGPVQELRARPELRLVDTPRHASVLLVRGDIPPEHVVALDRVHDQIPHPRAVVRWGPSASLVTADRVVDGGVAEVVEAAVDARRAVEADPSVSSPNRLVGTGRRPWRDVGPHGQGGEGMMGGSPFGRPMAMTGPDRDGLSLDRLHLRLGPFLPTIPPGLVVDVMLQGEVVQSVDIETPEPSSPDGATTLDSSATDAARQGLRWLTHGLHVQNLDGLSSRAAAIAARLDHLPCVELAAPFRSLRRRIVRSGVLWAMRDVAVVAGHGDAATRWRLQLQRIEQALRGDQPITLSAPDREELTGGLAGMTLNEAILTLASFDWQQAPVSV
ncbi:MAG: hypothetical protein AB7L17_08925 [Ilumatobacteraceae bacterium]